MRITIASDQPKGLFVPHRFSIRPKENEEKLKEYFAEESSRRISAAMRRKVESGVMPGCAPLAYQNAWVDGEKVIVIDPETAPKVRRLFDLASRKKMSVRKLAAETKRWD